MTQTSTAIPNWERRGGQALGVLLAAFVALHFYNALFGQFEPLVQRPIFIGFGIGGAFCMRHAPRGPVREAGLNGLWTSCWDYWRSRFAST
jgi:hypothetical protein